MKTIFIIICCLWLIGCGLVDLIIGIIAVAKWKAKSAMQDKKVFDKIVFIVWFILNLILTAGGIWWIYEILTD